jgi:hypothetical protein
MSAAEQRAAPLSLPRPVVDSVGRFSVVRDDYLPGGSKMRYLLPLVAALPHAEIVYGSPAVGYAQIALAHVCAMLGKRATIYVAQSKHLHPRTIRARDAGARIIMVPFGRLNVVQARARAYAAGCGAYLVPWGVDLPEAIEHFAAAARTIPAPAEVWACAGSGTLIRGLQAAWPAARFHAVQVGARPSIGQATLHRAPERYEDDAEQPPPYPSCSNYDAKVWRFAEQLGAPGALIWNVGA